jgi:diaminohydroxyphosphoribosylaminopyrimidine deaminase/5-amino-6-(5-phosphoribosylamino)uracil reductase
MTEITDLDRTSMARAFALAQRGLFTTTPNPRVGCVIVREGAVLGEGFHARAGEGHAETIALADARSHGHDPRGATMYVTLEPCNHHGRTPPCVDAILAAGVARVVAAMPDPNPAAAHGAARLRAAGIDVAFGLMQDEARELNVGFVSRMHAGLPWVR